MSPDIPWRRVSFDADVASPRQIGEHLAERHAGGLAFQARGRLGRGLLTLARTPAFAGRRLRRGRLGFFGALRLLMAFDRGRIANPTSPTGGIRRGERIGIAEGRVQRSALQGCGSSGGAGVGRGGDFRRRLGGEFEFEALQQKQVIGLRLGMAGQVRNPTQSGHRFRFDVGHRTEMKPATIPK